MEAETKEDLKKIEGHLQAIIKGLTYIAVKKTEGTLASYNKRIKELENLVKQAPKKK